MSDSTNQKIELPNNATAWEPCMISTGSIGSGTNIGALSHIGSNVKIGRDCRIQGSVYIADGCDIGDEVFIGPNATLTNDRYPPSGGKWKPIVVQNKVVIGANATIIAGTVLNAECVVGAGSVVSSDVPAREVWAGNPAKFMMTLNEYNAKRDLDE
jgi:acetyltransferase-like isoleucine patch superfamily enzyme|tara:strand:- start:61 stop:528 length:468 start_codon:yes stop_codon:yes gene_type:complete